MVQRLGQHLVAIEFANFPFEAGTQPGEGRVGELGSGFRRVVLGDGEGFEILGDGRLGANARADGSDESIGAGGFEGPGGHLGLRPGDEGTFGVELSVGRSLDLGGWRDELFPLHIFSEAESLAMGVDFVDGKFGFLTGLEEDLAGDHLQGGGWAGLGKDGGGDRVHSDGAGADLKTVGFLAGVDEEFAAGNGGSAFAFAFKLEGGDDFAFRGIHHKKCRFVGAARTRGPALKGNVESAICIGGGGMEVVFGEFEMPEFLAGLAFESVDIARAGHLIDFAIDDVPPGRPRADGEAPGFRCGWERGGVGLGGVFLLGRNGLGEFDGDHATRVRGIDIFIVVNGEKEIAIDGGGGIDAIFA